MIKGTIRKKFVIFIFSGITIFLLIAYLYPRNIKVNTSPTNNTEHTVDILYGCTRTTRLDNKPQYDRALSLIQQRLIDNHDGRFKHNKMHLFEYFPSSLVNCIKIIESTDDAMADFEGFFVSDNKDIKKNYYPIYVNQKYSDEDDILIVMLLVHEMTHVQQYIDSANNQEEHSCIDEEVEAYTAMHRFFISVLNSKEELLMFNRIDNAVEYGQFINVDKSEDIFDYQILILSKILDIRREAPCGEISFENIDQNYYDCVDAYQQTQLMELLENDEYYHKQCQL